MSTVRFAMLCDKCGRRSEEYGSWPSCADCGEDVCTDCDVPAARTEDEANRTICRECARNWE
jgi:NMD protein affecting ribosome stability and mRNA decay